MVSLVDVARHAKVSLTTASRVLSSSPHPVSEDKRLRVLQAARELNYSPSVLAKAMVTGNTRIVGVIVGDAADPYFASIVRGVEDVARAYGYLVIVCNSDRDPVVELSYFKTLNAYRVDGVIFAGGGLNNPEYLQGIQPLLERLKERGAVCVSLGKHLFPGYSVLVDFKQLVRDAANYLFELGHRRIAYISGPHSLTTTDQRFEGFTAACADHQIDLNEVVLLEGDFKVESGRQAAIKICSMSDRPSAVLASNDLMAIACLAEFKERGVRIPGEISVMGIDDITFARFVEPALTTIGLPLYELGKIGMQSLIELRSGVITANQEIVLPHRMVVRKSTASPPG